MVHSKWKTIFIHNPKCGGTSIYSVLGGQGNRPVLNWHCPWSVHVSNLPPQIVEEYFKFAFVRNPWDRLASAFRWYSKGGSQNFRDKSIQKGLPTFEEFVCDLETYQVCDVAAINPPFHKVPHFLPQTFMLGDADYDFIGRFETFREDASKVFEMIGIKNPKLPHKFKSDKIDYRSLYTDETRNMVSDLFAEDIERYGYNF